MSYQTARCILRLRPALSLKSLLPLYQSNRCFQPYSVVNRIHQPTTHERHFDRTRPAKIDDGMLNAIKKRIKFQFRKYKLRASGYYLYENIVDRIDYKSLSNVLQLPDTFHSWFLITELHVWMLMTRLMADPVDGRFIRNCLVEALWQDVTARAKQLGSEHGSVIRKQVFILNEEFQASIVNYDEGILSEDIVLASAIWRRLLSRNCDDPLLIEAMVKYVRTTSFILDKVRLQDIIERKEIEWITMDKLYEDLP